MPPSTPQPKRLAQYEILESLAATGKVQNYRAVDSASQRAVTLQTIGCDVHNTDAAATIAHFQNQARLAAILNHPGIVAVYESGEDRDIAFLATEYVEGCALKEGMRLPADDAVSIVVQLLTTLDYAHGQGVIHGNIAPSRLLLTSKGEVRLTDFGIAGAGLALASYMSPEQLGGLAIDHRSDIFAAGIFFYELLTGANPFAGPPDSHIERVSAERERAISAVSGSIPSVFDAVCAKALAKAKDDRYPTAGSFRDNIRNAYEAAFGRPPRQFVSNDIVVSIFLSCLRGPSKRRSSSKTRPQAPDAQLPPSGGISQWEDARLRSVEKQLAVYLGPLARVVIKEAASRAKNLDELYSLAAESLDKDDDRRAFLGHSRSESGNAAALVQQGMVSPDAATAAMLGAEVKSKAKPSSLLHGNHAAKPQTQGKLDSLPQSTGPKKVKADSNPAGGVESGGYELAPKADVGPDSKLIAASTFRPQKVQSDAALNLRPEGVARANSGVSRDSQLRAQSQSQSSDPQANKDDDVASRLEQLLGKQPADLAGYLRDSPPQLDAVIYAFIATLEALAAACASGGRVAGLAPQNICFDRVGKAKIQSSPAGLTQSTIGSGIVGSPRYAAPEIFAEENGTDATGVAANIYALGFMFFEILLGRQLFRKTFSSQRNELEWLRWHADRKSKAPTLKSLLPDHPAALSDLLETMTEKNAEKRATDLENILMRLRGIAQQASRTMVVSRPAELPQPAALKTVVEPRLRTRKRRAKLTLLIIMLALAALLIWQFPDSFRRLLMPFLHQ